MSPRRRPIVALLVGLCVGLCGLAGGGCVVSGIAFGDALPDAAGLQVGVSTRADVLATLGPPDEFARPTPWPGRVFDPQVLRVQSEQQLFGRDHWSWVREVRKDRLFLGWVIFNYHAREQDAERLVVSFDADGRVAALGRSPTESDP